MMWSNYESHHDLDTFFEHPALINKIFLEFFHKENRSFVSTIKNGDILCYDVTIWVQQLQVHRVVFLDLIGRSIVMIHSGPYPRIDNINDGAFRASLAIFLCTKAAGGGSFAAEGQTIDMKGPYSRKMAVFTYDEAVLNWDDDPGY